MFEDTPEWLLEAFRTCVVVTATLVPVAVYWRFFVKNEEKLHPTFVWPGYFIMLVLPLLVYSILGLACLGMGGTFIYLLNMGDDAILLLPMVGCLSFGTGFAYGAIVELRKMVEFLKDSDQPRLTAINLLTPVSGRGEDHREERWGLAQERGPTEVR